MSIEQVLASEREDILRIAAKHGARNVRLFGSAARGEASDGSDLDFLVEMEPGRSLLDLVGLRLDRPRRLLTRPVLEDVRCGC